MIRPALVRRRVAEALSSIGELLCSEVSRIRMSLDHSPSESSSTETICKIEPTGKNECPEEASAAAKVAKAA